MPTSRSATATPPALTVSVLILCPALLITACASARPPDPEPSPVPERHEHDVGLAADEAAPRDPEPRERALAHAVRIRPPYREAFRFAPDGAAAAVAYRLELAGGEQVRIETEPPLLRRGGVAIELFEVADRSAPLAPHLPRLVARAGPGAHELEARVARGGEYVVRIQPARGHEGLYRIAILDAAPAKGNEAALVFPVAGRDAQAIRSGYGAPRDGGRRRHNGVDIFAPRGTPVLAVADGVVRAVSVSAVGGKVIWLEAEDDDVAYYYAHLDEQLVEAGARVRAGDVIGRVGNTGNARRASPHLHFGMYRRGRRVATDPTPLLRTAVLAASADAEPVEGDVGALGGNARAVEADVPVYAAPAEDAAVVDTLPAGALIKLLGATGRWYRVELPGGGIGFVPVARLELAQ